MTLREVFNTVSGYHQDKEIMIKALWETSRFQILHLLSPHIKKGKNLRSTDIATFPWETTKPVDKEKIEKQIERAKYLAEKWK